MIYFGQILRRIKHRIGLRVNAGSVIHSMKMSFKISLRSLILILLFAVIKYKKMVMSFLEAVSW